jgi:hypothetical protein
MDQGSLKCLKAGNIIAPAFRPQFFDGYIGKNREAGVPYCMICGQAARFVNPFQLLE